MGTFGRALRRPGGTTKTSSALLEIYVILYDMLNDDDDEIRGIAATVASWILSHSVMYPEKSITFSPFAASDQLAEFLARSFQTSSTLFRDSTRRLTGDEVHRRYTQTNKRLIPVSCLMDEYMKERTVLFEVERQNLFVDDVREADIWTRVLSRIDASAHDKDLIEALLEWTTEGLLYLTDTVASEKCRGEPLGWSSKTEVCVLGIRVLNTATLLLQPGYSYIHSPKGGDSTIRQLLETLFEKGKTMCLHDEWLSRIESAIACDGILLSDGLRPTDSK